MTACILSAPEYAGTVRVFSWHDWAILIQRHIVTNLLAKRIAVRGFGTASFKEKTIASGQRTASLRSAGCMVDVELYKAI